MSIRILLVEDDPVSRELLAALLASQGHSVDTAEDGFNALRLVQETAYELVFIDYHLPEMDGYALARLIRSSSEKARRDLKMVAITADRFGLAARRGADTIFDHMLAKPIEPEALFAFVATLIDSIKPPALGDLENFLSQPRTNDASTAAQALWRARGIGTLPKAAVFPAPSAAEKASLECCFKLVEPDAADCFVLLSGAGRSAIERVRAEGMNYLQPLLAIDEALAPLADVHFKFGDGESWSAAAAALSDFAARRRLLAGDMMRTTDFDKRVVAYLTVANRGLSLQRNDSGHVTVPYTGGFSAPALLEAVRRLTAARILTVRTDSGPNGRKELSVLLAERSLPPTLDRPPSRAGAE